jgi:hypothetical protein
MDNKHNSELTYNRVGNLPLNCIDMFADINNWLMFILCKTIPNDDRTIQILNKYSYADLLIIQNHYKKYREDNQVIQSVINKHSSRPGTVLMLGGAKYTALHYKTYAINKKKYHYLR